MTFMRGVALAGCAAALMACNTAGSFSGEVDSKSLAVQDSVFFNLVDDNGRVVGLQLILSDEPNLCDTLSKGRFPKSTTYVAASLFRFNSDGTLLSPDTGNYSVTTQLTGTGNVAYAGFYNEDLNCTNTIADDRMYGASGLVQVKELKAEKDGHMSGTFDISFGDQKDKATGSFNADYCDLSSLASTNFSCE